MQKFRDFRVSAQAKISKIKVCFTVEIKAASIDTKRYEYAQGKLDTILKIISL